MFSKTYTAGEFRSTLSLLEANANVHTEQTMTVFQSAWLYYLRWACVRYLEHHGDRRRHINVCTAIISFRDDEDKAYYDRDDDYQAYYNRDIANGTQGPDFTFTVPEWEALRHSDNGGKIGFVTSRSSWTLRTWHTAVVLMRGTTMYVFDSSFYGPPSAPASGHSTRQSAHGRRRLPLGMSIVEAIHERLDRHENAWINGGGNIAANGDELHNSRSLSMREVVRLVRLVDQHGDNLTADMWAEAAGW